MRFAIHSPRSLLPVLALAALAVLATNSASAQSRMNVPFNFVAGGQNCPAGTYTVAERDAGSVVLLQGAGHSFRWLIGPGNPAPTDLRVMATFDRAGASYTLRSVQYKSLITKRLDLNEHIIAPAGQLAKVSQVTITAGQ